MEGKDTRALVARELQSSRDAGCVELGKCVADADCCWAEIADAFRSIARETDCCVEALERLIRAQERGPLLLFLHLVRDKPEVLAAVVERLEHLPVTVQCAFVAMSESAALLAELPEAAHPAALRLASRSADIKRREARMYGAKVTGLLALRRHDAGFTCAQDVLAQIHAGRRTRGPQRENRRAELGGTDGR